NIEPTFDRFTSFNLPGRNYKQGEGRFTFNLARQFTPSIKAVGLVGFRTVKHEFVHDGDYICCADTTLQEVTQFPFDQRTDENLFYEEVRLEKTPHLLHMPKESFIVGVSHEGNKGSSAFTDYSVGAAYDGWQINYLNPVFPDPSTWIKTSTSKTYHLNTTAAF